MKSRWLTYLGCAYAVAVLDCVETIVGTHQAAATSGTPIMRARGDKLSG
jgi:hypothetical protein